MQSQQHIIRHTLGALDFPRWLDPPRAGWWTALILLLAMTGLMLVRRLSSAFDQPLSAVPCVVVGLAIVAVSAILRRSAPPSITEVAPAAAWRLLNIALSSAGVLLLVAVTVRGTPLSGAILAWCCFVGSETAWWTRQRRAVPGTRNSTAGPDRLPAPAARAREPVAATTTGDAWDECLPPHVRQRWLRTRTNTGGESLWGTLRVDFARGELHQAVHVAFCPPLNTVPEFHVEQAEGAEVNLAVAQLATYGVRIEARRSHESAEAESIVLQFEALSATSQPEA